MTGLVIMAITIPTFIGAFEWNSSISSCMHAGGNVGACGDDTAPSVLEVAAPILFVFGGVIPTLVGASGVAAGRVPVFHDSVGSVELSQSRTPPITWSVAASPTAHGGYRFGVVGAF